MVGGPSLALSHLGSGKSGPETCPQCGAEDPTTKGPPCPRCGSTRTMRLRAEAFAGGSLIGGSCLLWIPVIGWVLAPLFFFLALLFGLGALIPSGEAVIQCRSCMRFFRAPKNVLDAEAS